MADAAQPPSDSLKAVLDAYSKLSVDDKNQFIQEHPDILNKELQDQLTTIASTAKLPSGSQPSQAVVDYAWRIIIGIFAAVFLLAALGVTFSTLLPFWIKPSGTINTDILITIFSTTVGFLAGVLTPSPVGTKQPA